MNTTASAANHRPLLGFFFAFTAATTFSAKAIIIKIAYSYGVEVTPLILLTLRMALSLPFFVLAIILLERGNRLPALHRRDYIHLVGLAFIGYYLASYLDFLGLNYISASLERLILLLYPTLVVVLSALVLKRHITAKEVISLVTSYLGIIIVFYQEMSLVGTEIILGSALIFGSATAFAIYLIGSGEMVKRLGALRSTAYAMTFACLITLGHFSLDFDQTIIRLPHEVYGLALIMAVVSTVIPTFFMGLGIKYLGTNSATIISSLGPIMTIYLAYIFLGEQLTTSQFLGAVLVMCGALLASTTKPQKER